MKKPPVMPLYVRDAVNDTSHLPGDAFKALWVLTWKSWSGIEGMPPCHLPAGDDRLQELSCLDTKRWAAVRHRVLPLLTKNEDGTYVSKRAREEFEKLMAVREARAESGKHGGKASAKAKQRPSKESDGNDSFASKVVQAKSSSALASASALAKEEKNKTEDGLAASGRKLSQQQLRVKSIEDYFRGCGIDNPPPASSIAKWLSLIAEEELMGIIDELAGNGKLETLGPDLTKYIYGAVKGKEAESRA